MSHTFSLKHGGMGSWQKGELNPTDLGRVLQREVCSDLMWQV